MLYQRLLLLFPESAPAFATVWCGVLVVFGLLLLVAGSRIGRGVVTLTLVALGAVLGKYVPALVGMKLDPMACVMGAALALGVFGYVGHRWLAGVGLACMASLWTFLGYWMTATTPATWAFPEWVGIKYALPYVEEMRRQFGAQQADHMAAFAAVSFLAALALTTLAPRLASCVFWTMTGTTMALGSALAYGHYTKAPWMDRIPDTYEGQTVMLGLIVLFGLVCQWPWRKVKAEGEVPAQTTAVAV